MCTETIRDITTARQLRDILNNTPDHLLDLPVMLFSEDANEAYEADLIEVLDIIEDGARVQLIRLSAAGEV